MAVPFRAVSNTICAAFYAELETQPAPTADPAEAWRITRTRFEPVPGDEPEAIKMREDLDRLGEAEFRAGWAHLLAVYRELPAELHLTLARQFAPRVADGLARRRRRKGQA